MKKKNSVLHWGKQQKAKISQKSNSCIFGTCKDVLTNGFFVLKYQHLQFGSPAAAWFTPLFCSLRIACSPLSQVEPKLQPQGERADTGERYYAEHAVTLYRSLLEDCAVHVLKPRFCFKPHGHSHLPHSKLWFPGVTGSFSPTSTSCWLCPQPLASGNLAPPESKQCSRGQQRPVKWTMHLYLLNSKKMDWNLSLQ